MRMMTRYVVWMYATMFLSFVSAEIVGVSMGMSKESIASLWFGLLTAMWISGIIWMATEVDWSTVKAR